MNEDPHEQARHVIKQAERAAKRGDHAAAERWTRTAERLALAASHVKAAPQAMTVEEDEALCAELRERLVRYAEADWEVQAWDTEKAVHDALSEQAQRHGLPPPAPLRPCPYSEEDMQRIAIEGLNLPPSARFVRPSPFAEKNTKS